MNGVEGGGVIPTHEALVRLAGVLEGLADQWWDAMGRVRASGVDALGALDRLDAQLAVLAQSIEVKP